MQFFSWLCTFPCPCGNLQVAPGAKAYVYVRDPSSGGNGALAQLYDSLDNTISNPAIADGSGFVGFAAANGNYNIQFTSADGTLSAPLVPKVQFFDPAGVLATEP